MGQTIKLAEYLFRRLRQLGIDAMHGVPGDFNLTLLDYVEPSGLRWVGNANELNAGYAADGYARTKGIGALITTFGVGELSASNAIAGAYAERAAVVHIVGTPGRPMQDDRVTVHHTFNDGNFRRFGLMAQHVTVAQTSLRDPRTSPGQIDEVLKACLLHSRPVYIEFPVDLVDVAVPADGLETPLRLPENIPTPTQDKAVAEVLERIYSAKEPMIYVDGEIKPLGVVDDVQSFVKTTQWPTWVAPFAKGLIDEADSNYHGTHRGKYSTPSVTEFWKGADLVICFGPHFSTTNTNTLTSRPKKEISILITDTEIQIESQIFRDVPIKFAISSLLQKLDVSRIKSYKPYPNLTRDSLVSFSELSPDGKITQDKLWRYMASFWRPGDIIMGETGSASYGAREMVLPQHSRAMLAVTWLSIGYMLPAAQGVALAQQELMAASKYHGIKDARTILMIGDGSLQMTIQELGTIIRLGLNVVVIVINNDGYTIERCIHGVNQHYNDVSPWRYLEAPSFFGGKKNTFTALARTWGELEKALGSEEVKNGDGLRMIEVKLDREDFPEGALLDMLNKQKSQAVNGN